MARFRASKCGVVFVITVFSSIVNGILCQSTVNELPPGIATTCVSGGNQINYTIYNRSNLFNNGIDDRNEFSFLMDSKLPIVFLIHGLTSEANYSLYQNLTQAWLKKDDVNMITVDWKGACSDGNTLTEYLSYLESIEYVQEAGRNIAQFIVELIKDYGIALENMFMVGYGVGGHVAGLVAKQLQNESFGTIPQILALDPIEPGFSTRPCSDRLCKTDANFLQVYHTSNESIHQPLGHADFYFNGGHQQPDCFGLDFPCSHSKSIVYLANSLDGSKCSFIGVKWNRLTGTPPKLECSNSTCSVPGINAYKYPARGSFYVDTMHLTSFCQKNSR